MCFYVCVCGWVGEVLYSVVGQGPPAIEILPRKCQNVEKGHPQGSVHLWRVWVPKWSSCGDRSLCSVNISA